MSGARHEPHTRGPGIGKGAWVLLWAAAAASVAAEFLLPFLSGPGGHEVAAGAHAEPQHWWTAVPGFYALFGLLGCAAIILISKWIGHAWLMKPEDYWGAPDEAVAAPAAAGDEPHGPQGEGPAHA